MRLQDAGGGDAAAIHVRKLTHLIYRYTQPSASGADAADPAQEMLRAFSQGSRLEYAPQLGSFRGWLFTLAHHRLYDFGTPAAQARMTGGTTANRSTPEFRAARGCVEPGIRTAALRLGRRAGALASSRRPGRHFGAAVDGQSARQVASLGISAGAFTSPRAACGRGSKADRASVENGDAGVIMPASISCPEPAQLMRMLEGNCRRRQTGTHSSVRNCQPQFRRWHPGGGKRIRRKWPRI